MDVGMSAFAYIAAVAMVGLGLVLLIAPVRTMQALHEWYIWPPALQPRQRLGLMACRVLGTGLVLGGCSLAVSITYAISRAV